jgi:transposase-like protein
VSEVAKRLAHAVRRYHERKMEDRYRFLFFDGVVLEQKGGVKVQKKIILCAYVRSRTDREFGPVESDPDADKASAFQV